MIITQKLGHGNRQMEVSLKQLRLIEQSMTLFQALSRLGFYVAFSLIIAPISLDIY